MTTPERLYAPRPEQIEASQLTAFIRWLAPKAPGLSPEADLRAFGAFAIERPDLFWEGLLNWHGTSFDGEAKPAIVGEGVEHARFFPGVALNYAENLLAPGIAPDEAPALLYADESGREGALSRGELRAKVTALANALAARGVGQDTQVVALARNTPETIIAVLATAALGATWSSAATDLGAHAVIGRFEQLRPKVLFYDLQTQLHGRKLDLRDRVLSVAQALGAEHRVALSGAALTGDQTLDALIAQKHREVAWPRVPFDHPLFVLFSSGTTGRPKCIVHGVGGTLLEHIKEHRLHGDLGRDDRLYFHTTCGWMMWNWQLSALSTGAAVVTYDGSATYPGQGALLQMLAKQGVTRFGTSPSYLTMLEETGVPIPKLSNLRTIYSTGSILWPRLFRFARGAFGDVPLHSISGGTDIIGCFVLGSPHSAVHAGESPGLSLGHDVRALSAGQAQRVPPTGAVQGELVCANAFPSRPVAFLNDPDGAKRHAAYFAQNEGVWTHGDRIELTDRGSARILGRSDGTMNIRGVRIGPAELYQIVLGFQQISEAMAVEQKRPRDPDGARIVLLVVMQAELDRRLTLQLKRSIRDALSAVFVPAVIAQVTGLPRTHNGKLSERAATEVLNGREVPNLDALANPEVLKELKGHPLLQN